MNIANIFAFKFHGGKIVDKKYIYMHICTPVTYKWNTYVRDITSIFYNYRIKHDNLILIKNRI